MSTVSFPANEATSSLENADKSLPRMFFVIRPFSDSGININDGSHQVEQYSALKLLSEAVELHGIAIFPGACFPPITHSSASGELHALLRLREQYVERLTQLNQRSVEEEKTNVDEEDADDISFSERCNGNSCVERLRDHKRNTERLRVELKELIHALAGVMADHKNLSLCDIISEYKNL